MKIGILIPSRERIAFKQTVISSILNTVSDIDNVNLYFGIDDDDPTRNEAYQLARQFPFVHIIPVHNAGRFIGINRIWNILAANCPDQIFECLGDDSVFRTKNWDKMVLDEFSTVNCPADRIKLVHCWDGCYGEQLCINHFIDRKYYEVVGYFCKPEFMIGWSDQWMYQTMKAFDRITYRKDIFIEHVHFNVGSRQMDNINRRMLMADQSGGQGSISDKLWFSLVDERIEAVNKLAAYLKLEPNWKVVDRKGRI
jgi:hypothetical protein